MRLFKLLTMLCVAVLPGLWTSASATEEPEFQLGREYGLVQRQAPLAKPRRIQVEEFFLYGCPHCFAHEAALNQWLKRQPADVDFVPVPNSLGRKDGEVQQRGYYIAATLGITARTHEATFNAIHLLHQPMNTLEAVRALYVSVAGIKPAEFDGLAHSFVIDSAVQQAENLAIGYGIAETPAFVAGGRYQVYARPDPADTFKALDYVIGKLREERALPAPKQRRP